MKHIVTTGTFLLLSGSVLVAQAATSTTTTTTQANSPAQTAAPDVNGLLKTDQDRLSYAMGVETGKAFKEHQVDLKTNVYSVGVQDGLKGNKTLMTDDEIQKQLQTFQETAVAQLKKQMKEQAVTNQKQEQDFLSTNKAKSGVKTTASGLQYKVVEAGTGPQPTDKDVVTVDYEGKLLDGKVFDSSYKRGKPATFPVGAVIPGWQEALKLMKKGDTWELYIPAKLAYGEQGAGGIIGPNEMLIFKVHLISINQVKNQEGDHS